MLVHRGLFLRIRPSGGGDDSPTSRAGTILPRAVLPAGRAGTILPPDSPDMMSILVLFRAVSELFPVSRCFVYVVGKKVFLGESSLGG